MKKILLSIVILFSIAMHSQDQSEKLRGTWSSSQTSYYVVILHDETKGYEFINFSFQENKSLKEVVVEAPKKPVVVELSIQDIVLSANIIDLATQRGAFKAAEAGQVGACFEKLVAFIKANTPQPDETPADTKDAKESKKTSSKEK